LTHLTHNKLASNKQGPYISSVFNAAEKLVPL